MRNVDVSKRSFFKTVCCGALGLAAGIGGSAPAVAAQEHPRTDLSADEALVNVRRVVDRLKVSGAILMEPLQQGRLKIIGARYDLDDGRVEFLEG